MSASPSMTLAGGAMAISQISSIQT
jgi:hypothetical protein